LFYSDVASFTYTELFHQMTDEEVVEAMFALDMISSEMKKKIKEESKKKR